MSLETAVNGTETLPLETMEGTSNEMIIEKENDKPVEEANAVEIPVAAPEAAPPSTPEEVAAPVVEDVHVTTPLEPEPVPQQPLPPTTELPQAAVPETVPALITEPAPVPDENVAPTLPDPVPAPVPMEEPSDVTVSVATPAHFPPEPVVAPVQQQPVSHKFPMLPVDSPGPRCLSKTPRKPTTNSALLTQADIAQEIMARAEKKRQTFPDAMDVLVAMKSPSKIKIPILKDPPHTPPKLPKLRDENKLDAKELLLILQDGADSPESNKKSPTKPKTRNPRPKLDLKIDPDLEKQLALKQLMEFSKRNERKPRATNNNVDSEKKRKIKDESVVVVVKKEKPEKTTNVKKEIKMATRKSIKRPSNVSNGPPPKRGSNRELQRLLQDEGAINMLYDVEKGDSSESRDRLSSRRSSLSRLKKVLKKKAQEVEEAILVATSSRGSHRSTRTSDKRKQSVESMESEETVEQPPPAPHTSTLTFPPAEASKIIRRHSSSSSYSSRGSSPRRMSLDRDRSPSSEDNATEDSRGDLSTLADLKQELADSTPMTSTAVLESASPAQISERTEKLIEMKVRELNLQPCHGAMIKRLIVEKKNGLKERLQSEFAVKFKAALPKLQSANNVEQPPKPPGVKLNAQALAQLKAKTKSLVTNMDTTTPAPKPVWKIVAEDWDSGEDNDDPDDPTSINADKVAPLEKRRHSNKAYEADIRTFAECLAAGIKKNVSEFNASGSARPATITSRTSSRDGVSLAASSSFVNPKLEPVEGTSDIDADCIPRSVPGSVPGSDVRLERMNAIIRLYIKPTTCRLPNSFSVKVLNELTQALTYLESSSDTRVIVLVFPPLHEAMAAISDSENDLDLRDLPPDASAGRISPAHRAGQHIIEVLPTDQVNHSNGIDLLALCADSPEERRTAATQTATAIKDLTLKLAMCSRSVCTAVSGKAIGLSVVMLAYCDFVLADETATFSAPYSQLGYLPEAAAAHTLPQVIGRRKTSWLLLGNGILTASEAETCGLVTRVVPRQSHLAHELNTLARSIAATSMLASESTKGMMNHSIRSTISNSLRTEARVLETHWSAPDTQHRMKNFAVQLILDMHKAQWKERESRVKESEIQIQRTPIYPQDPTMEPISHPEEFEVPPQHLVFEEPSDHLDIDPLQPIDDIHFEDPTITLQLPDEDHTYELKQLR